MSKTVLVLGCGSIGRRHIANLQSLGRRVVAYDPDPARLAWVRRNLGCETTNDPRRVPGKLEAVWVCTPPHLHERGARPFLRRGIPCFVEKPIAHVRKEARALAASGRRVGVGYMLRRVPALIWIKKNLDSKRWGKLLHLRAFVGQYLPDWRPWQDYRKSYTASRVRGGGVLLDCSHELDLARWLAGEVNEVYCRAGKLSALKVSAHDTAEVVLGFKSGAMGSVHMDMISRGPRRGLELLLSEATVVWDMPSSRLKIYTPRTKRWTEKRFPFKINDLYMDEARAFLSGSRDIVSAADADKTLALIEAAERSARARKAVRVK